VSQNVALYPDTISIVSKWAGKQPAFTPDEFRPTPERGIIEASLKNGPPPRGRKLCLHWNTEVRPVFQYHPGMTEKTVVADPSSKAGTSASLADAA
jgi:hypothetical protein